MQEQEYADTIAKTEEAYELAELRFAAAAAKAGIDLAPLKQKHSKHARFITINGVETKFHMTRVRPWVRVSNRRAKNKVAKASRKRNR